MNEDQLRRVFAMLGLDGDDIAEVKRRLAEREPPRDITPFAPGEIEAGDTVWRAIAELTHRPDDLYVVEVSGGRIYTTLPSWYHEGATRESLEEEGRLWTFDAEYGLEIDERHGWGVQNWRTGSRIIGVKINTSV